MPSPETYRNQVREAYLRWRVDRADVVALEVLLCASHYLCVKIVEPWAYKWFREKQHKYAKKRVDHPLNGGHFLSIAHEAVLRFLLTDKLDFGHRKDSIDRLFGMIQLRIEQELTRDPYYCPRDPDPDRQEKKRKHANKLQNADWLNDQDDVEEDAPIAPYYFRPSDRKVLSSPEPDDDAFTTSDYLLAVVRSLCIEPTDERLMVMMMHGSFTHAEIAKRLGLSRNTVRKYMQRLWTTMLPKLGKGHLLELCPKPPSSKRKKKYPDTTMYDLLYGDRPVEDVLDEFEEKAKLLPLPKRKRRRSAKLMTIVASLLMLVFFFR